jgi:hypothetical protein
MASPKADSSAVTVTWRVRMVRARRAEARNKVSPPLLLLLLLPSPPSPLGPSRLVVFEVAAAFEKDEEDEE